MKKLFLLFFCSISLLMLSSCASNEYTFYQSTTATLAVYDYNTATWTNYRVAVDVYSKKGEYDYYKIKNEDGVEYGASRAMIYPSEFQTWDGDAPFTVNNFRHGDLVGTLYLPF